MLSLHFLHLEWPYRRNVVEDWRVEKRPMSVAVVGGRVNGSIEDDTDDDILIVDWRSLVRIYNGN